MSEMMPNKNQIREWRVPCRSPPGQLLLREIPTGGNLRRKSNLNNRRYTTYGDALEYQTRPGAPSGPERIEDAMQQK